MNRYGVLFLVMLAFLFQGGTAQTVQIVLSEDFDDFVAPEFPALWWASAFTISSVAPRSMPNAAAATGNLGVRELRSPTVYLRGLLPVSLIFYERRSSTAALYRLEVSVSTDQFQSLSLTERFDTIGVVSSYVKRTVDLSPLSGQNLDSIQVRWLVLPDSTNATGVLRIDDVEITARDSRDFGFEGLGVRPDPATSRDTLILRASVRNDGLDPVTEYGIEFTIAARGDENCTGTESFAVVPGPPLGPGDSAAVEAVHPPLPPGLYRACAVIVPSGDNNRVVDTASVEVRIGHAPGSVLISEIMYAPQGDEPEWVELVNITAAPVNLNGWSLSDHGLVRKPIVGSAGTDLAPLGYAIVARDAAFLAVHPTVRVPVFTAEFSPLNNTSPDGPVLFNDQGVVMDSVRYDPSWGGHEGRSLERTDIDCSSGDPETWTTCVDSLGSTPGAENSTARRLVDLAVLSLRSLGPMEMNVLRLEITVGNLGKTAVEGYELQVYDESNRNGYLEESELVTVIPAQGSIAPAESVCHWCDYESPAPGEHLLVAVVRCGGDQRRSNDQAQAVVQASHSRGALVINEIMYQPLEGLCEWIELLNRTTTEVDLHGWELSDTATPSGAVHRFLVAQGFLSVRPGGLVVIAADSTIFGPPFFCPNQGDPVVVIDQPSGLGFANEGDAVILRDASGKTIDSLAYDPGMHHPYVVDVRGRSLERIRPDGETTDRLNWSTAAGARGGSPGSTNTIAAAAVPSDALVNLHPNPFSPDNDGWEDFCVIELALPFPMASVRVRIFDTRGRLIRSLAFEANVGTRSQIIWDGLDDQHRRAAVGPYVVLVEVTDQRTGRTITRKLVAVLARRL